MSREERAEAPAWSLPGPDECEFCLHSFHVETGYYCLECDRPICPLCIVTVHERHAVYCPECEPGDDA